MIVQSWIVLQLPDAYARLLNGRLAHLQLIQLRTELDWVIAESRAGRLTGPEAKECLQSLSAEAPDGGRAAAALTGLAAGSNGSDAAGAGADVALKKVG